MRSLHWGIHVDSETPITGVVDTTAPEWLLEEIEDNGIGLDYEEHIPQCSKEIHDDCYDPGGATTLLLGYMKDEEGEFVLDPNAEFSAIVNGEQNITQIVC